MDFDEHRSRRNVATRRSSLCYTRAALAQDFRVLCVSLSNKVRILPDLYRNYAGFLPGLRRYVVCVLFVVDIHASAVFSTGRALHDKQWYVGILP